MIAEVEKMSKSVQQWENELKSHWGLNDFELRHSTIHREVSPIKTTEYKLDMEWFPPGTEMEDDLNPPGTVATTVNLTNGVLTSFIVVMSEDHRENPPILPSSNLNDVVAWIELQTGLKYKVDFQYKRKKTEDNGEEYLFIAVLNGKKVSPGGWIEIKVNEAGSIVFYSLYGYFPAFYPPIGIEESPKLNDLYVKEVIKQQVILFGTLEEEYKLLYGVEETFVDGVELPRQDELIIRWEETDPPVDVEITDQYIGEDWDDFRISQTITEEEIANNIAHPDTLPISVEEKQACIQLVTNYIRNSRPHQNGEWKIEKFERDYGDIHMEVVPVSTLDRITDKLKITYNHEKGAILSVLDKKEMFSRFMDLPAPPLEQISISQEQAIAILEEDIYFEEHYVYDIERKKLKLMYKIDCDSFVNAVTGEKFSS